MCAVQPLTSNVHLKAHSAPLQDSAFIFVHVKTVSVGLGRDGGESPTKPNKREVFGTAESLSVRGQ